MIKNGQLGAGQLGAFGLASNEHHTVLSASIGPSGLIRRRIIHGLIAILTSSTQFSNRIVRYLVAKLPFAGFTTHNVKHVLKTILSFTGLLQKSIVRISVASLGLFGSSRRRVNHRFAAQFNLTAFLRPALRYHLNARLGFSNVHILPIPTFLRFIRGPDQLIRSIRTPSITQLAPDTFEEGLSEDQSRLIRMRNQTVLITLDLADDRRMVSKSYYDQND